MYDTHHFEFIRNTIKKKNENVENRLTENQRLLSSREFVDTG